MLGEKINHLRKEKGLSQEELAELIGVTRQTISNWELGSTFPNPEQLKLLSKTFHISIDELLGNDIKEVLVERISNTEKLAGIIIKILKVLGIFFLLLLVIDIVALIIYASSGNLRNIENSATILCKIDEKEYEIEFGTNESFQCDACSNQMKKELKELVDVNQLGKSMENIESYFISHDGSCE